MSDSVRCPICKREIPAEVEARRWRPFCSPRCRSIDLGGWLSESYRVSSPSPDAEEDQGPPVGDGSEPS